MSTLAVEGLRVRLPTPAGEVTVVDGVDYDVQPAEVFGIAGESGSGKTVSMLALLGLLPGGWRGKAGSRGGVPRPPAGRRARGGAGAVRRGRADRNAAPPVAEHLGSRHRH